MGSNDRLLLSENPDVAIDFGVTELVVVEIPQSRGHLILSLVVEKDMECSRIVIDLKLGAHWLLDSSKEAAHKDDVIDRISIELADVIGTWLRIHDHAHRHGCEHFGFAWLVATTHAAPATSTAVGCRAIGRCRLIVSVSGSLICVEKALGCSVCKHRYLQFCGLWFLCSLCLLEVQ